MTARVHHLTAALADRYRLERQLGQGGMATVYPAEDLKHHRQVAIKVLRPELAAVLGADRFGVEIKTTAALQHPISSRSSFRARPRAFLYRGVSSVALRGKE